MRRKKDKIEELEYLDEAEQIEEKIGRAHV